MSAARQFKSELVAVFGQPIAENPTQCMMEAAFRDLGIDWRYLTIEVAPADLADAIRGMRAMGFRGANCTIPHKVAVVLYLDELSPAVQAIGAVNCIVRQGNRLLGENTDGKGFLQSLQEVMPVKGTRAVLLGAGGAARAIGVELLRAGCAGITVVNRSRPRGEELVAILNRVATGKATFVAWQGDYAVPPGTDVLINATSIGLFPDVDARVPLKIDALQPATLVCDVIPNPPRTRLVRDAESRGCRTLDGLGMLVNQGVIGIRLWTGLDPNPVVMRDALEEVFGSS
ncbi:MAG: shikimate dehydrogenase [Gemmataceae bacterium]